MSDDADSTAPAPRDNAYLLGHDAAGQAFLSAWQTGRMAHAWLLSGPRGIGKATLAYRIARFVLAQGAAAAGPDLFGATPAPSLQMAESHPVFAKVKSQGHPDFRSAEREKMKTSERLSAVVTIEQIRKIIEFMYLTPAESAWRVVLIDDADAMNAAAANAVLKVLEEPPRQSMLILVAHNADRLLPTIRSRCRRLELRPLVDSQVQALIGRYRPDLVPRDVQALTGLADGSVGRALELAEEGGVDLFAALVDLFGDLPTLKAGKLHALADVTLRGDNYRTVTALLTWWLARVATLAAQGRLTDAQELLPGERAAAAKLAAAPARLAEIWQGVSHLAERTLALNIDKKRSFIAAALQVAKAAA
ncbi:MAG: DNA polymerase III subunit delta' [Rhodospirillaceae bacterium]|nr:DNA polymerase III subunit delta' [Rhodospirillaceae bacterium]